MTERLVSLQAVKDWLGIKTDVSDKALIRIINAASQFTLNYLNRDGFAATDYTQNFRGNGKCSTLVRNWPVISVSAVGVNGTAIPLSVAGANGLNGSGFYISDQRGGPQSIELAGYNYWYGAQCQIVYRAGWETTETYVIEGNDPLTAALPYTPTTGGTWTIDEGIKGEDGVAWTKVKADPVTLEYTVDEWGVYNFSVDDVGKTITFKYDYVPDDLSQAVLDMIGLWYTSKDRIGVLSKTLAGQETVTFDRSSMPDTCEAALQFYMNVVPI